MVRPVCHKLGGRKYRDRTEGLKEFFKNDPYGWSTLLNASYLSTKFNGNLGEYEDLRRMRPIREAYLAKLWKYHNRTNPLRLIHAK